MTIDPEGVTLTIPDSSPPPGRATPAEDAARDGLEDIEGGLDNEGDGNGLVIWNISGSAQPHIIPCK